MRGAPSPQGRLAMAIPSRVGALGGRASHRNACTARTDAQQPRGATEAGPAFDALRHDAHCRVFVSGQLQWFSVTRPRRSQGANTQPDSGYRPCQGRCEEAVAGAAAGGRRPRRRGVHARAARPPRRVESRTARRLVAPSRRAAGALCGAEPRKGAGRGVRRQRSLARSRRACAKAPRARAASAAHHRRPPLLCRTLGGGEGGAGGAGARVARHADQQLGLLRPIMLRRQHSVRAGAPRPVRCAVRPARRAPCVCVCACSPTNSIEAAA